MSESAPIRKKESPKREETGGVFQKIAKLPKSAKRLGLGIVGAGVLLTTSPQWSEGAGKKEAKTRTEKAQKTPPTAPEVMIRDLKGFKSEVDSVIDSVGKTLEGVPRINMSAQQAVEVPASQKSVFELGNQKKEEMEEIFRQVGVLVGETSDLSARLRNIKDAADFKYEIPSGEELDRIVADLEAKKLANERIQGKERYSSQVDNMVREALGTVEQIRDRLKRLSPEDRAKMAKQRPLYERIQTIQKDMDGKGFTGEAFEERRRMQQEIRSLEKEIANLSGKEKVQTPEDKMLEDLGGAVRQIGKSLDNLGGTLKK